MARDRVLITGASAGIGVELARCFAREGSDLVLVARREAALETLAQQLRTEYQVDVRVMAKDLSVASAPAELNASLLAAGLTIDVLVNNAGFGLVGRFDQLPQDRQMEMIHLNVDAVAELARLFLPGMVKQNRGGIINVASTAAFQPGPHMAVYFATKAFVLSFSEALSEELVGTNVRISCLCPGPTATEFGDVSGMGKTLVFKMGAMTAKQVAEMGHEGFRRGKPVVITGLKNWLGAFLVRFAPRALVRKVVKRLQG